MGMFDRIWIKCPDCGEEIQFQSKAGKCILADYYLQYVPGIILADLDGESENCKKCGRLITIRARTIGYIE